MKAGENRGRPPCFPGTLKAGQHLERAEGWAVLGKGSAGHRQLRYLARPRSSSRCSNQSVHWLENQYLKPGDLTSLSIAACFLRRHVRCIHYAKEVS